MGHACADENIDHKGMNGNSLNSRGGCDHHDTDNWLLGLKRAVKMLHFGNCWEEKELAAEEIKKLVVVDLKRRRVVAELGVIPPLVAMVRSQAVARQRVAVGALVELAEGSFTNRAVMVEAGILSALPENVAVLDETFKQELAQLLLSLSALANTQCCSLNSSRIVTITVSILESCSSPNTKELCLNTLYNLSSVIENAATLASRGVIDTVIKLSVTSKVSSEVSERALSILGNLVVTLTGRKSIEDSPLISESLIEIVTWDHNPKCQELSAYILMILAHQSSSQRRRMSEAGIVQVLLELALLGTPLAQKRALKLLQWFKDDERHAREHGPHSGPQVGRSLSIGSPVNNADEGKRLMKKIVKQSLRKNMETITRRANNGYVESAKIKALATSSSSKSLPY